MSDISGLANAKKGVTSAGVPFVALPPEGHREPKRLVVLARYFDMTYEWTDERRALAAQLSTTHRARAIAEGGAAVLLGVGEDDPGPIRAPAEQLAAAIRSEDGMAEVKIVPNVAHAFVDEPGEAPAPQGPQARAVDELASGWFNRYLR